jgi:hypothetical protein
LRLLIDAGATVDRAALNCLCLCLCRQCLIIYWGYASKASTLVLVKQVLSY